MLAFPWWQQKCSGEAVRVAGVRSLSCRSGGTWEAPIWAWKTWFLAGESCCEAAEFVQVCSEVLLCQQGQSILQGQGGRAERTCHALEVRSLEICCHWKQHMER